MPRKLLDALKELSPDTPRHEARKLVEFMYNWAMDRAGAEMLHGNEEERARFVTAAHVLRDEVETI